MDQNDAIKRYSPSHIRPFVEQASVLDDAIADRCIEDNQNQTHKDEEEPLFHEENVQLSVDLNSFSEHSVSTDNKTRTERMQHCI